MTDKRKHKPTPDGPGDLSNPSAQALDVDLDIFFDAARSAQPEPSPELMARVLDDALAMQPPAQPLAARPAPSVPTRSWLGTLLDTLGGWPAAASLATATLAGVWIGISPPDAVSAVTAQLGLAAEAAIALPDGEELITTYLDEG
ncbi:MAG: hypothetical protein MK107_10125 [Oceanicola sp.]|nr:hypothetical protein [Oceanicola sp.]